MRVLILPNYSSAPLGTALLPTFSFASDPDTGMYNAAADTLAFSTAGVQRVRINSGGVTPGVANTYDIGSSGLTWRTAYFDTSISNPLFITTIANQNITFTPNGSGVVVCTPIFQTNQIQNRTGSTLTIGINGTGTLVVPLNTALRFGSGTNQLTGNAVLVAGTVTVANARVTANSVILLTRKTAGGTIGDLTYTLSAGTSFTINSANAADTSTVSYLVLEAA